jgi:hypothetical protein
MVTWPPLGAEDIMMSWPELMLMLSRFVGLSLPVVL